MPVGYGCCSGLIARGTIQSQWFQPRSVHDVPVVFRNLQTSEPSELCPCRLSEGHYVRLVYHVIVGTVRVENKHLVTVSARIYSHDDMAPWLELAP